MRIQALSTTFLQQYIPLRCGVAYSPSTSPSLRDPNAETRPDPGSAMRFSLFLSLSTLTSFLHTTYLSAPRPSRRLPGWECIAPRTRT